MKNIFVFAFTCLQFLCFGQAPEGVNYQAVIRDNAGNLLENTSVGLKISIYQTEIGGSIVFEESFTESTNNFGLVNLIIGKGTPISGDISLVDWANGPYFIEISADENGGMDYELIGTQELMSVPYALYAKTAGNGPQGDIGPQGQAGTNGTNGIDGINGADGAQGIQGNPGLQGDPGIQGNQGIQGNPGLQGDPGIQGIQGVSGDDGLLPNGTAIGNTTFWNGTEWAVDNNNLFNSGGNIGIGTSIPQAALEVQGNVAINYPFAYKIKDAADGDNFLKYEPTVDGLQLNGSDAVFITTSDPTNATSGQDLVVRNGRVGINTNTPSQGLLHVNGYYADPFGNYTFYATGPNTGIGAPANLNTSIFATHRVVAGEFNAISDARIKNIDGLTDSKKDLEILNKIEITDYHMIDPTHGTKPIKKAIAQQLETIYPQAVSKSTNIIPDIYEPANCESGKINLENTLEKGDRVRLIFEDNEEIANVTEAYSNHFKVDLNVSGKVFVYGCEVDDFRTIDYEAVSMLNVSATQALLKRVEVLEKENNKLKESNRNYENFKAELETLKNSVLMLMNEKNTATSSIEK